MLEASGDAKRANYSREDESARRLWLTQRTKANPWENRSSETEDEQPKSPLVREIAARAPEEPATLIPQHDRLQLEVREAQTIENPFAKLVLHRMGLSD